MAKEIKIDMLFYKRLMYSIFFKASASALTSLNKWEKSKDKFFIPVKVLSRKFRGKFLYYLRENFNKLKFYKDQEYLYNYQSFQDFMDCLYKKEWIVYCKKPFKSSTHVIDYLGRYTHGVAISNNRIVKLENDMVTFKWRDYKDNSIEKEMTLTAVEFIRRFLLHILPSGFTKIRYYCFLGNRSKNTKLRLCQKLTGGKLKPLKKQKLSAAELLFKLTGRDITLCPCCGNSKLHLQCSSATSNSPPIIHSI